MALAGEAFPGHMAGRLIQRQLIGFFVDGLAFDYLKRKVLRDTPPTLDRAVLLAIDEQNLRKQFELRTPYSQHPSTGGSRQASETGSRGASIKRETDTVLAKGSAQHRRKPLVSSL